MKKTKTIAQRGQQCFDTPKSSNCFFQRKMSGGNALLSKFPLKIFEIKYCLLSQAPNEWRHPKYSAPNVGTFPKSQRKVNYSLISNQFRVHVNFNCKLSQYDTY